MITPPSPHEERPSPGDPGADTPLSAGGSPEGGTVTRDTLLVALDGSSFGESGLAHARILAETFGSRLHLVTVLDPARSGGTAAGSAECRLQKMEASAYLERLARELEEGGLAVSFETREGVPDHEILAAASERDAALVALASRSRRRTGRLVSRGVALGIIASGTRSLLVVRGSPSARGRGTATYRKIAVSVDGSLGSHRALRVATSLARRAKARIVLIHVLPDGSVDLDRLASDRTRNGELASGAAGSPPGGGYLQNLAGRLGSFGVEADAVVRRSDRVADAVDEAAQEAGADLLVLGARGAGGASARYGRCARRLLLHGETHLLV
ncbi:MAG: universal stress protein, partial [Gemmatimonadota bacterium]